jgi:hypothetical protein
MEQWQMIALIAAGAVAGALGGLLGVGGSVIMIPAMMWILGLQFRGREGVHQYQAAAMIVNSLLVLPSLAAHWRAKAIWTGVWKVLVPSAAAGLAVGVSLSYLPIFAGDNAATMRYVMGAFFLYVAARQVEKLISRPGHSGGAARETVEGYGWARKAAVGGPMGVLAGLLGIGGGAVAVPAQQMVLHMPLRNAIATSAATIACTSWFGAILKNAQLGANGDWRVSLKLAALLAPPAMLASYFGGRATHRLPTALVRAVFAALMLASGVRPFWPVLKDAARSVPW